MSDSHGSNAAAASHPVHAPVFYVKIWAVLCALLLVSVVGPMVGIRWLTLITAFGIAIVKAYLVARNFMHLNIEKRFVVFLLLGMLAIITVMFFGISPDVMKHAGQRWDNRAAQQTVEKGLKDAPAEHE